MPPLVVFSFAWASACFDWYPIDDPVMGGRSASSVQCVGGHLRFSGHVSLENNGGFASIRSQPGRHDLGGYRGVVLQVRGDGKRYKVNLRTDGALDGVQYQASFIAPVTWSEVELPFESFVPRFRGRPVPDAPPLDPSRIATFGLLISDRQEGAFTLDIAWMGAYR